ncbi:MAG: Na+/H+ antiporter NhaA [Rhodocyclaceae bacterium]|nr:Na+/H+ antiporter NhaA [Rhodocyclaceae bacterium]
MSPATRGRRLLARLRSQTSPELRAAALLLLGTIAALVWANSPWGHTYATFWQAEFALRLGGTELSLSLYHWVNDGLMAFFFFIVGLEVKRELVLGELADRRRAMVPILAAVMGLIVPALVYGLINRGGEAASAWGMVISTDTAFLLGVIALLGRACPSPLRIFLLALAVVDDIGALAVIAIFYTEKLHFGFLMLAAAGVALMFALRWLRVWRGPAYLALAAASWVMLHLSGVHATLLGVVIALITPAYRVRRDEVAEVGRLTRAYLQHPHPARALAARLSIERSVPVGERLQALWRPWTDYVIVPLFALANAGVVLSGGALAGAATSPVTLGAIAGLVLGKPVGILLGCAMAVGLKLGQLAPGLTRLHLAGGSVLCGIGFTISLLIVGHSIHDAALADQARVGILAASLLAAVAGFALLRLTAHRMPKAKARTTQLQPPVDAARDHIRGPADAPLTLVGFGDFAAPFQGWGMLSELRERFGDRLRYVYRHVPRPEYPHSHLAAEAAEAAGAQGRFWEMHDRLFQQADRLSAPDLVDHAAALGLDVNRFAQELGSGRYRRRVDEDLASARDSGVDASHSFFVNGERYLGVHNAESLAAALIASAHDAAGASLEDASAAIPARPRPWNPDEEMPNLPEDLAETEDMGGDHPRLTDAQLARIEAVGERRKVARGDVLYQPGDASYDFHVVLSGAVAVVGYVGTSGRRVVRVHGARRFLGALDLLRRQPVVRTAVVIRAGEVLRVPSARLRALFAGDVELRDLVARAFLMREVIGRKLATDLCILANPEDPRTRELQAWAADHGLSTWLGDAHSEDKQQALARLGLSVDDLPVVLMPDGTLLRAAQVADVERVHGDRGGGGEGASHP